MRVADTRKRIFGRYPAIVIITTLITNDSRFGSSSSWPTPSMCSNGTAEFRGKWRSLSVVEAVKEVPNKSCDGVVPVGVTF